jgi:hypothetical protein
VHRTNQVARRQWPWKNLCLGLAAGSLIMLAAWWLIGFQWPVCRFPEASTSQPAATHDLRGTFGDQFGAVNALFSGLALVGVVIALILQQRELWLALEEQRRLNSQHRRALQTEIILSLMGNINSEQWGNAHRTVAQWAREHPGDFITKFKENRTKDNTPEQEVDKARRILVDPYHKVIRLSQARIISERLARAVLTPDICWTLYFIIRHLEQCIRSHTDLMGPFVLKLYKKETLIKKGRYYDQDQSIENTSDQHTYEEPRQGSDD